MTEDSFPRGSPSEPASSTDPAMSQKRKRRKWDQPEESLVSAGACQPPIIPFTGIGSLLGVALPGVGVLSGVSPAICATLAQQQTPKIQDELIAREIVINDADSAVRYKLTKRQTPEEIQKITGAVVITRGKYRLPTAPPDGGKPLYLHISAGAHLETTVEKIRAVDHAASLVEEILKEGSSSNGLKANPSMSICVYVGFEVEASLNIAARIRGPNDQYINHIMNETGATVMLRGQGSDGSETVQDTHQPLHLFLSSNNPKSLEHAKLLAENLLDTISAEFGASRVSSSKVYGAVPPPPQLLAGSKSLGDELEANTFQDANLNATSMGVSVPAAASGVNSNVSRGIVSHSLGSLNMLPSQPHSNYNPCMPISSGTSYMGYGGIYPQVTPLQQVALALRQSISATASSTPETSATTTRPLTTMTSSIQKERHKRKFRELPMGNATSNLLQTPKDHNLAADAGAMDNNIVPGPMVVCQLSSNVMPPPPPPPKMMKPMAPPPPPKINYLTPKVHGIINVPHKLSSENVSSTPKVHGITNMPHKPSPENLPGTFHGSISPFKDTLVKLMEYGDDDDDDTEVAAAEETLQGKSNNVPKVPKPFWAV